MIGEFLSRGVLVPTPSKVDISKAMSIIRRKSPDGASAKRISLVKSTVRKVNDWEAWEWARDWKRWSELPNSRPADEPVKPDPHIPILYVRKLVDTVAEDLLAEANELFNAVLDEGGDTTALSAYRKSLREIDQQVGYPDDLVWPRVPI